MSQKIKIKVGNYDILDSGSIIGTENDPIDFIFNESTEFIVRLSFAKDDSKQAYSVTTVLFGKNGVQFTFTNCDNPLGMGNIQPLKIGNANGRELFFNYRIYSLGEGNKELQTPNS